MPPLPRAFKSLLIIALAIHCAAPQHTPQTPTPVQAPRLTCGTQPGDSAVFDFLVLNDSTRTPIKNGYVYAIGLKHGAPLDSLGRARLALPSSGPVVLAVHATGYQGESRFRTPTPKGLRCSVLVALRLIVLPVIQ